MRINPATRHSETKYGFVILTGDMIFEDFFVGVKLLLRHEHLSSAAADSHQNQLTCHASKTKLRGVDLLTVRQTAVVPSPRPLLSVPQKVYTGNVVMDAVPVDPSRSSMAAELIAHATSEPPSGHSRSAEILLA